MLAASSPSLWSQLAAAIPLALLATLSPTSVAIIIWYLGLESPRRLASAYLGGAFVITAVVAVAALFLLQGTQTVPQTHPAPSATIDILLGAALLVTAVVVGRHHAEPKETERQRRHDPRGAFFLGVVMWTPSIAYLAALKLVSDVNAPAVSTMLASLVLIICVLLIIEIPIGLYFFFPDRTERDLKAFNGWLHRHGRTVLVWGLAAAGVYMLAHGVSNATAA